MPDSVTAKIHHPDPVILGISLMGMTGISAVFSIGFNLGQLTKTSIREGQDRQCATSIVGCIGHGIIFVHQEVGSVDAACADILLSLEVGSVS